MPSAPRPKVTREFRNYMLKSALLVFGGLVIVLMVLVKSVPEKVFAISALVLIPCTALVFNLQIRRAYAKQQRAKR
ncbi:hypothetical protein ACFQBQ_13610 [Granulicella cerasi]|uniref:DUF3188 domain-containing protein n=1 Tax=Granulicella cerasi TaxID=741063 RepID=A0ABW1ZAY6_9BACT|nr:hypothetical protein [Granulicella cerasi]